jgi:tetratricopeptide (TPR) repeat protein
VKRTRGPGAPRDGFPFDESPFWPSPLFRKSRTFFRWAVLLVVCVPTFVAAGCASSGDRSGGDHVAVGKSDSFPLDPREDLAPPFPDGVESGWRALAAGDAAAAEQEFLRARGARPYLAAEIGLIESRVLLGRTDEALASCREALAGGPITVALLVACGEARARAGQVFEAHELYARAAAREPGRAGLKARTRELEKEAIESLARTAAAGAKDQNFAEARRRVESAIAVNPGDAGLHALAGEIELSAGQSDRAFERYREAHRLDPKNVPVQEQLAELALDRDPALAVEVLDALARHDDRYRDRANAARLAFRVSNWPAPEREAAQSERLTRAEAAALVWWMFPEIREAKVKSSVIATDVVSRKDSRAVTRAVSLGLLDVDPDTHRARPDTALTRRGAARLTLRLLRILNPGARPECLEESADSGRSGAEAVNAAVKCGLLDESEATWVGGREFTRGLDRVRVLATGKGGGG